jgi:hypothetical protein
MSVELTAVQGPPTSATCVLCTTSVSDVVLTSTSPRSAGVSVFQSASGNTLMSVILMSAGSGLGHGIKGLGMASSRSTHRILRRRELFRLIDSLTSNSGDLHWWSGDYIVAIILRAAILFMFMTVRLHKISLIRLQRAPRRWLSLPRTQFARYVGAMQQVMLPRRHCRETLGFTRILSALWSTGGRGSISNEVVVG